MRMFAEKGHTVDREEFRPFVGMGEERFMGGVAEARGIPFDPVADVARMYQIYLEIIPGRLQPLRGAREFVANCRAVVWPSRWPPAPTRSRWRGTSTHWACRPRASTRL